MTFANKASTARHDNNATEDQVTHRRNKRLNITIVVMGDLGRSPRMQFHALGLAKDIANVTLIGLNGKAVYSQLTDSRHINCIFLPQFNNTKHGSSLLHTALRVLKQSLALLKVLAGKAGKAQFYLLQVPPALPAFTICHWLARIRGVRLILDWHNFGYTVLASKIGARHPLVRFLESYERRLGQKADSHLCVSEAMNRFLSQQWRLHNVHTLYDQPGTMFHRNRPDTSLPTTKFTVVCPSSWGSDDDFDLLLEALPMLEQQLDQQAAHKPDKRLCILLSGEGPGKELYVTRFEQLKLQHIELQYPWVDADEYPALLARAHLGLSLHCSTSKLDLPMKVLDMQGSGLVVCALNYGESLGELIQHGSNGLLFNNARELVQLLLELIRAFPATPAFYDAIKHNLSMQKMPYFSELWHNLENTVLQHET